MIDLQPGAESFTPGQPRPNFFIAGVGKAGTTSLYEYLRQHPQVFMSANKEPCYFVHGYGLKNWEEYLALFQDAGGAKAVGESSSIYSWCGESAGWIKKVLGEMKIILLLRNPARRAFSLYAWMAREGYEDAPTFAEALQLEPERLQDLAFRALAPQFYGDYYYFTTGLYADQVSRCFETFGRERVKVFLFEEFVRAPLSVCRDVFRFLGVDEDFEPATEVHNEGRAPKSIAWQYWLRGEARRRRLIGSRSLRRRLAERLMAWNVQLGAKPRPDPALMRGLTDRYRPDIERLQALLGRDLSGWLRNES